MQAYCFRFYFLLVIVIIFVKKNGYDEKQQLQQERWVQVWAQLQHHHKQQVEYEHAQQHAAHQARHQWRCWFRQLRGAHRALSVHVERTLPQLVMSSHTSFGSSSEQSHCHLHVIHGAFSLTFGEFNDSSVPFSFMIPFSDQDVDDVTLGKMLTEAHRGQVDYCEPEGMSVSQSSSLVGFDGSGQLDGDRNVDQSLNFGVTRFLKTSKL